MGSTVIQNNRPEERASFQPGFNYRPPILSLSRSKVRGDGVRAAKLVDDNVDIKFLREEIHWQRRRWLGHLQCI